MAIKFPNVDKSGTARATATIEIHCHAPKAMFVEEWQTFVSRVDKEILRVQNGLPCEGEGGPGLWCINCNYSSDETLDIKYAQDKE